MPEFGTIMQPEASDSGHWQDIKIRSASRLQIAIVPPVRKAPSQETKRETHKALLLQRQMLAAKLVREAGQAEAGLRIRKSEFLPQPLLHETEL